MLNEIIDTPVLSIEVSNLQKTEFSRLTELVPPVKNPKVGRYS